MRHINEVLLTYLLKIEKYEILYLLELRVCVMARLLSDYVSCETINVNGYVCHVN